ncbi:Parkin co-regulated protein, partial [Helicosporidium sp. ATCC 50920]
RRPRSVLFRKLYDRADLPCKVDHDRAGRTGLRWTLDPATLDVSFFLPIFIDGLVEIEEPYRMLSDRGITALLEASPQDVAGAIPRLILPLKCSLRSRDPATLRRGLTTLCALAKCSPEAGAALVGYFHQLLPPLNHIMHQGPGGRWSGADEGGGKSVYASVLAALRTVEAHGGSDALKAIKFNIPTYQRL